MKFNLTLLLVSILAFNANANIFRVNSSLTTDASQKVYKTINEADAAASAGDTLMIEGSNVPYVDAIIDKTLVLIGPGYFLTQNPQTQADATPATVGEIDINLTAMGSVLEGLTFSDGFSTYAPNIKANDVVISRCYLPNQVQLTGNISNIFILENYFVNNAVNVGFSTYSFTGVTFKNNFVGGSINISSSVQSPRIFSSVENNIFVSSVTLTASDFRSNIITGTAATVIISSTNIQNNLVSNGQLTGNGNQTYTAAQLFVGATGTSTDGQYKFLATSPYLTAGYGNTQPGIYGGAEPYVLSGLPAVPSIYEFNSDAIANKQTGLPVQIKVKANQ